MHHNQYDVCEADRREPGAREGLKVALFSVISTGCGIGSHCGFENVSFSTSDQLIIAAQESWKSNSEPDWGSNAPPSGTGNVWINRLQIRTWH